RGDGWQRVAYHQVALESGKAQPLTDEYAYNGGERAPITPVHDFLVECEVEVLDSTGALFVSLTDGQDTVAAELAVSGVSRGGVGGGQGERRGRAATRRRVAATGPGARAGVCVRGPPRHAGHRRPRAVRSAGPAAGHAPATGDAAAGPGRPGRPGRRAAPAAV